MSEVWNVQPPSGVSALMQPKNVIPVDDTDWDAWNRCPICDAPNKSCFHLPGVTNATSSPPSG